MIVIYMWELGSAGRVSGHALDDVDDDDGYKFENNFLTIYENISIVLMLNY